MNRYKYTNQINKEGTLRQLSTRYPHIEQSSDDTYVITTVGDRFDSLANEYYGNSGYWWVIAVANPHLSRKNFVINQGEQLRIPANIGDIISRFEQLNR